MTVLVVSDHNNSNLVPITLNTISAALEISDDVDLLIAGENLGEISTTTSKISGISKILRADDNTLSHQIAENVAPLIVNLAKNYSHILFPSNTSGKNIAPRVAALLDVAQISDIVQIISEDTFVHPIYAGNAMATVQSSDGIKVITVRGTAFVATSEEGGSAAIESINAVPNLGLSQFVGQELTKSERPELTSARIIISGGRGMQSGENFEIIEKVADKLGAAVGASRAAVDAG